MRISKPKNVAVAGERQFSFEVTVNETRTVHVAINAEAVLGMQPGDIKPNDMQRAADIIARDPNHRIVGVLLDVIPRREGEGDADHPISLNSTDFHGKR